MIYNLKEENLDNIYMLDNQVDVNLREDILVQLLHISHWILAY